MYQRKLLDQMMHIKKSIKSGKTIEVLGIPANWTPHDLITHYIELYNILDEAKSLPDASLIEWAKGAKSREDLSFTFKQESKILSELTCL
jgi:hypothetical protein